MLIDDYFRRSRSIRGQDPIKGSISTQTRQTIFRSSQSFILAHGRNIKRKHESPSRVRSGRLHSTFS